MYVRGGGGIETRKLVHLPTQDSRGASAPTSYHASQSCATRVRVDQSALSSSLYRMHARTG